MRFSAAVNIATCLFIGSLRAVSADATEMLQVGTPKQNGTIEVMASVLGKTDTVKVTVQKGMDPEAKAAAITAALNGKGVMVTNPPNSNVVEAPGATGTIAVVSDTSNEDTKISGNEGGDLGLTGLFDFSGTLTGHDDDGNVSEFDVSFGSGSLFADAFVSYDQLNDPTIEGLLEELSRQLREDLPVEMSAALRLDLDTETITFDFPAGASNYFVESDVTDITVASSLGLTFIPEPPTLFLTCAGLIILISRAKRMQ